MERIGGVTDIRIGHAIVGAAVDGDEPIVAVFDQPSTVTVADALVAAHEGSGVHVVRRTLPDGEEAKRFAVAEDAIGWLAAAGVHRSGVVVGVGGGALTDAVGFIAAVFMRGVEARYVPTTLLGAVDAAIGGKTALNVNGKNLAGTFTHPARVVVDLDVLAALPAELRAEGMAEAYKAGLIGDAPLAAVIETEGLGADLEEVVTRAIRVKIDIVDEDFTEAGRRAHLNFGHTVGHAVETLSGWRHGPSVAVGMVAAAAISARRTGFDAVDRIRAGLGYLGLPISAQGLDRTEVERLIGLDKKRTASGVQMVLLEGIGRPVVSPVDEATLRLGLETIGIT
jgi:3-dehydroquinate synthetase